MIMQEYDIDSSGQIDLPEFEAGRNRICVKGVLSTPRGSRDRLAIMGEDDANKGGSRRSKRADDGLHGTRRRS